MSERRIQIGLLDFSWVNDDMSPADALSDTFALAERAEALGFARFWVGEHHVERHACGSPQVLAGILAASTRRIRIGVGAMLLHYWAPLKLAEDFCLLEAIFGRMDLGVGRGRADNLHSHRALLDGRQNKDQMLGEEEYAAKLIDLMHYLRGTVPTEHPHRGAAVIPALDVSPEVWVCGSATAAPLAARTGTRFCCTLFHGRIPPPSYMTQYRRDFRASRDLSGPYAAVAVAGVCADTTAEAVAMRDAFANPHYLPSVVGTPEQCREKIEDFCRVYMADEIIFLDIAPDRTRRMRSAELLARALELQP
jgi:luciferase family oxidoreductase group 1